MPPYVRHINDIWRGALRETIDHGVRVSPRGQQTFEIANRQVTIDAKMPVLTVPARKLSYIFMVAEAYWMLTGDDRVETIAPFNQHIQQFSDDGVKFFGAYGPKIVDQIPYVVRKLIDDPDTRQAVINIWRENPPGSRDIPCTVSMVFTNRNTRDINVSVFMRSSDLWLGLPYDLFNFSMVLTIVVARLNAYFAGLDRELLQPVYRPGTTTVTAVSSHLYERNARQAHECLDSENDLLQASVPEFLYTGRAGPERLLTMLERLRFKENKNLRWWYETES